jgi:hypothetical protein
LCKTAPYVFDPAMEGPEIEEMVQRIYEAHLPDGSGGAD